MADHSNPKFKSKGSNPNSTITNDKDYRNPNNRNNSDAGPVKISQELTDFLRPAPGFDEQTKKREEVRLHQEALESNKKANEGFTGIPLSQTGQDFFTRQDTYKKQLREEKETKAKDRVQKQYYGETFSKNDARVGSFGEYMTPATQAAYNISLSGHTAHTDDVLSPMRDQIDRASERQLSASEIIILIQEITKLNISLTELNKVFPNNPQMSITIEKLIINANDFTEQVIKDNGNITFKEGAVGVVNQGNYNKTEIEIDQSKSNTNTTTEPTGDTTNIGGGNKTEIEIEIDQSTNIDITPGTPEIPTHLTLENIYNQLLILQQKLKDPSTTIDQSEAIEKTINAINSVINVAGGNIEINNANQTEIIDNAQTLVDLSDEEEKELEEAGENEEGFLATIKRTFKGSGWKKFTGSVGKRFASNLAISSIASGTVALLGPVGATLVGGAMVAMGGATIYRGFKTLKAEAKAQGKTMKNLWADKEFRKGLIAGTLTTGVGRVTTIAMSSIIPGVGGILGSVFTAMGTATIGTTLESGVEFITERNFQGKQREFLDKLSSNYNLRNYSDMNRRGYLINGDEYEGQKMVDVQKIITDLKDEEIKINNIKFKFAKKAAVSTLLELYKHTDDEKYRYIEYGTDENKQTIDLTKVGLTETQDNTSEYPMLKFEPPIDTYLDTINVEQLSTLLTDGWSRVEKKSILSLGMKIIENFSGLEAAQVDEIVSTEKKMYFEKVNFMSGFRMASTVVNGITAVTSGGIALKKGISAFADQKDANVNDTKDGKVYVTDLNADGKADMYKMEDGTMIATSARGAERIFELQNGFTDTEIRTQTIPNSTTGIAATLVNTAGEVVGVSVTNGNGIWNTMSISELETPLSATLIDGNIADLDIVDIQPSGIATIKIGDMKYDTNLGSLDEIPAIKAIDGVGSTGSINIHHGDSMPVLLRNALTSAMKHNPNLETAYKQDPHIMERLLYKGNYLGNDAAIRNEANLTNPLRVENNDGVFEFAKSSTVMSMLENLNGGEVVLPAGTEGSVGTPGYKLSFDNSLQNNLPTLEDLSSIEIPASTPEVSDISGLVAVVGLGLATFLDRKPHVMTRQTTINSGGTPTPTGSSTTTSLDDNTPQLTPNIPIRKSEIVGAPLSESDSAKEELIPSEILLNTIEELKSRGVDDKQIRLKIMELNKNFHSTLFPNDEIQQQQLRSILNATTVAYESGNISIELILPFILNALNERFPDGNVSKEYIDKLSASITALNLD